MSLGTAAGQIKIAGLPSDTAIEQLERAVDRALRNTEQMLKDQLRRVPKATGTLRDSFKVHVDLSYWPKEIRFGFFSRYAQYVLEFGRASGKRPPWVNVKRWAQAKGVDLKVARAWWWKHSAAAKMYYSPQGEPLLRFWSRLIEQFKYYLEIDLARQLQLLGFNMSDIEVRFN